MQRRTFIKGAATIALGGFLAKLIGALYRIPLLSLIGGEGMGLYQLVYPFYCLLLTVSATGIPSSIAKLVSERYLLGVSDRSVLKNAAVLFLGIGFLGTVLMIALAPVLSSAQGAKGVKFGYIALAPSVFLVSAISVLRGWFQGRERMFPTAASETAEQLIKVGFGLLFAYLYRGNTQKAVTALLFAVTLSELFTLVFLWLAYKKTPRPFAGLKEEGSVTKRQIFSLSAPVTLSAAALPFTGLLESVLIVRLLSRYTSNAVALYGLFTGGAVTLINLPVSICYGIAAVIVPSVSEAKKRGDNARKKVLYSLFVTLAVSVPSALALFFFSPLAVRILYRALSVPEKTVLIRLVRIFSLSAVTLSATQTLSACLTAQGKPKHSLASVSVASLVRLILDAVLVSNPKISVYGAAISASIGYLVAFFMDLLYNLSITSRRTRTNDYGSRLGVSRGGSDGKRERGNSFGG